MFPGRLRGGTVLHPGCCRRKGDTGHSPARRRPPLLVLERQEYATPGGRAQKEDVKRRRDVSTRINSPTAPTRRTPSQPGTRLVHREARLCRVFIVRWRRRPNLAAPACRRESPTLPLRRQQCGGEQIASLPGGQRVWFYAP